MNLDKLFEKDSDKSIDTPFMKIQGNILSFKDYFIQISNISQVSIEPVQTKTFPITAVVSILLGMSVFKVDSPFGVIAGILLIGWGVYTLYSIYQENLNRGENLTIQLNSGYVFRINFKTREFLNEVMEVLQDCANNKNFNAIIDIQDSIVTLGDENKVEYEKHT